MLTNLLSKANPYTLYIKIGLVVVVVAALVGTGTWIRGVWAERAALRVSEAAAIQKAKTAEATTKMYADQWNENAAMQREVADAIRKIKVQSHNYINTVETSPPPAVADGEPVVLMRHDAATSPPAVANHSTGGASPGSP